MEEEIKQTLRQTREFEAQLEYLSALQEEQPYDENISKEVTAIKLRLLLVSSWMKLLTDDEAFVTKRHLIDGIDIPRIVAEYETKWGREFAKSERTIKTYQQRAIRHIEEFERRKAKLMGETR